MTRLRGGGDPDRDDDRDHEIHRAYRLADAVQRRYWQRDTPESAETTANPPERNDHV